MAGLPSGWRWPTSTSGCLSYSQFLTSQKDGVTLYRCLSIWDGQCSRMSWQFTRAFLLISKKTRIGIMKNLCLAKSTSLYCLKYKAFKKRTSIWRIQRYSTLLAGSRNLIPKHLTQIERIMAIELACGHPMTFLLPHTCCHIKLQTQYSTGLQAQLQDCFQMQQRQASSYMVTRLLYTFAKAADMWAISVTTATKTKLACVRLPERRSLSACTPTKDQESSSWCKRFFWMLIT